MSQMPWVRFFPSDWLAGTRGMSAAETGVYISLIAMMYERGEPIVEDAARLARLCGASNAQFKKALETLISEGKIQRVEGGLWNGRVEKEVVYRSEKSEVGKQAAEKRWRKDKQNQRPADADAMPTQCEGNANQKPDTRDISSLRSDSARVRKEPKKSSAIRPDWSPDEKDRSYAASKGMSSSEIAAEAERFLAYHQREGKPMKDWNAAWRTWVLSPYRKRSAIFTPSPEPSRPPPPPQNVDEDEWRKRLQFGRERRSWVRHWGPPPGSPGCMVPDDLLRPSDVDLARSVA